MIFDFFDQFELMSKSKSNPKSYFATARRMVKDPILHPVGAISYK